MNCGSLESIEIGQFSFSDYAGDFELKCLASELHIDIGAYQFNSYNFYNCSFVASGYFCIFYSPLDLPSLKSIELGRCAFAFSIATVIEGIVYY